MRLFFDLWFCYGFALRLQTYKNHNPPTLPSSSQGRAAPGTTSGVELCLSTLAVPIATIPAQRLRTGPPQQQQHRPRKLLSTLSKLLFGPLKTVAASQARTVGTFNPPKIHPCSPYLFTFRFRNRRLAPSKPPKTRPSGAPPADPCSSGHAVLSHGVGCCRTVLSSGSETAACPPQNLQWPNPPQRRQSTLAALAMPSFLMVWAAAVQSFLPVPKPPPAPLKTSKDPTLRSASTPSFLMVRAAPSKLAQRLRPGPSAPLTLQLQKFTLAAPTSWPTATIPAQRLRTGPPQQQQHRPRKLLSTLSKLLFGSLKTIAASHQARTVGTFNPPKIHPCSPYLLTFRFRNRRLPPSKPPTRSSAAPPADPCSSGHAVLSHGVGCCRTVLSAVSKPLQTRSLQTLRCAFQAVSSAWAKALSYGFETAVCPLQTLRCALQAVSSAWAKALSYGFETAVCPLQTLRCASRLSHQEGPKPRPTLSRLPFAPSKPCAAPCRLSHQQGQGQSSVLWFRDCRLPPPNPALRLPGCLISQGQSSVLRFRDRRLPPSNPPSKVSD